MQWLSCANAANRHCHIICLRLASFGSFHLQLCQHWCILDPHQDLIESFSPQSGMKWNRDTSTYDEAYLFAPIYKVYIIQEFTTLLIVCGTCESVISGSQLGFQWCLFGGRQYYDKGRWSIFLSTLLKLFLVILGGLWDSIMKEFLLKSIIHVRFYCTCNAKNYCHCPL